MSPANWDVSLKLADWLRHDHVLIVKTILFDLRGLVKLKIIQKSEKNSDCPDNTHPPAYPFIFLLYGNMCNEKTAQNTQYF